MHNVLKRVRLAGIVNPLGDLHMPSRSVSDCDFELHLASEGVSTLYTVFDDTPLMQI